MKIEIYGAEWCGYCKSAVSLCKSKIMEYDYFDVDDTVNLRMLEERMGSKVRTIPQIFIDGNLLEGGFTSLQRELTNG